MKRCTIEFVLLACCLSCWSCLVHGQSTTVPVISTTLDADAVESTTVSPISTTTVVVISTTTDVVSTTVDPSSSSSTQSSNTIQPPIVVDHSKTIGVLLGFSIAGVGIVSGILIYIWIKSKREEKSRYETLADKMMTSRASTVSLASTGGANIPNEIVARAVRASSIPNFTLANSSTASLSNGGGGFFTSRPSATASNMMDYSIELPESRRNEFVNRGFDNIADNDDDEENVTNVVMGGGGSTGAGGDATVLDIGDIKFDSFHNKEREKSGETSF